MHACMYVCMYVIEINNNKHVYRQSQVRMPKQLWGRVGWMLADRRDGLLSSIF